SSLFGEDERWAMYPRVAANWITSEEPWFPVQDAISLLRFRGAWGQAGARPSFSAQYFTYSIGAGNRLSPGVMGNPLLKPEHMTEFEVGFDAELFRRVGLVVTYAHSTTEDQLLPVPLPFIAGYTSVWQNAGTLQNKT